MSLKMEYHSLEVYSKLSTYPQQYLFAGMGRNSHLCQKVLQVTPTIQARLTTSSRSKVMVVGGGGVVWFVDNLYAE